MILKIIKRIVIVVAALLLMYMGLIWYAFRASEGNLYVIEKGYRGWICITYEDSNATELKKEEGNFYKDFLRIEIPSNGVVKMSNKPNNYSPEGYYIPTYDIYVSKEGKEMKDLALGGGYTVSTKDTDLYTNYFWISTKEKVKEDYEKYVKDRNKNSYETPRCGKFENSGATDRLD